MNPPPLAENSAPVSTEKHAPITKDQSDRRKEQPTSITKKQPAPVESAPEVDPADRREDPEKKT